MTERTLPERVEELRGWQRHKLLRKYNCDGHVFPENITLSQNLDAILDALDAKSALLVEAEKALEPFAELACTSDHNGYGDLPDDYVVRSAGTLGDDYAVITVGDLRRAGTLRAKLKAANAKPAPQPEGHGTG